MLVYIIIRRSYDGLLRVGFLRRAGGDGGVIGSRLLPDTFQLCGVRLFQHLPVGGLNLGLVALVIVVADHGIQRQPQSQQKQHCRKDDLQIPSLHVFSPDCAAPEFPPGQMKDAHLDFLRVVMTMQAAEPAMSRMPARP